MFVVKETFASTGARFVYIGIAFVAVVVLSCRCAEIYHTYQMQTESDLHQLVMYWASLVLASLLTFY